MKKINLLIISVYYPPILSVASNRIYSFAKYLDKKKYNIYVLSLDDGKIKHANAQEADLEGVEVCRLKNNVFFQKALFEKKTNIIIHKLKAFYNTALASIVLDEYRDWRKRVVAEAKRIIEENKIDVILSSYAPIAPHLAAWELKNAFPYLKWIADMRDEMSKNPYSPVVVRWRMHAVEKNILRCADSLTSVSKPILDAFRQLTTNAKLILREIRNGYDFELEKSNEPNYKKFVITYTGSFYGDRTPSAFFKALDQVIEENHVDDMTVNIMGAGKPLTIPSSIKKLVVQKEKGPHAAAIECMRSSSLLLLIHPRNERKGFFTGKLFEYMASLRPILALVDTDDVAARLIKESRTGYVAESDNIDEIKDALLQAYNDWRNRKNFNPDIEIIKKHHRKEQAHRLQGLIMEVLGECKLAVKPFERESCAGEAMRGE